MKVKNVLLVGTSFSAISIAHRIKKHGFQLISIGSQAGEGVHNFSDQAVIADYSDFEKLEELTRDLDVHAIVPSCNDIAYANACRLAHHRGIFFPDKPERVKLLHEKDAFKSFLRAISIDTPSADPLSMDQSTSVIVKPVDSYSGRGCVIVPEQMCLSDAVRYAKTFSASDTVVIEEFVNGTLHSLSSFVTSGKIYANFFADELCIHNKFAVSASIVPTALNTLQKNELYEINKKIIENSEILEGLVHTQFIVSKDRIVVLETMRRAPGDLLGQQHLQSTGLDYWEMYINGFLPQNLNIKMDNNQQIKTIVREIVATDEAKYFECLDLEINTAGVSNVSFIPLITSGNFVDNHPKEKIGILLYETNALSLNPKNIISDAHRNVSFKK